MVRPAARLERRSHRVSLSAGGQIAVVGSLGQRRRCAYETKPNLPAGPDVPSHPAFNALVPEPIARLPSPATSRLGLIRRELEVSVVGRRTELKPSSCRLSGGGGGGGGRARGVAPLAAGITTGRSRNSSGIKLEYHRNIAGTTAEQSRNPPLASDPSTSPTKPQDPPPTTHPHGCSPMRHATATAHNATC